MPCHQRKNPLTASAATSPSSPVSSSTAVISGEATPATLQDTNASASASNYTERILNGITEPLPPITWKNWYKEVNLVRLGIVTLPPLFALIGIFFVKLRLQTVLFSVLYAHFTGIGLTGGYHRLWAHRSYKASRPLEYFLAVTGAGVVQDHIFWWCKHHRSHHRYTDTDLDPYNAHRGLWWSHIGWLIRKRRKQGRVDVSDLEKNDIVQWQRRYYIPLAILMGFVVPTVIPWYFWDDPYGGAVCTSGRVFFVHHSTFCVNSLAHWLGETTYDDKRTARDHFFTSLVSMGEGYHNFHHMFPTDYRNGARWHQWDPTKWFLWACQKVGLATHLNVFPENEVEKSRLTMKLKKLRKVQDSLVWPVDHDDLPIVSWASFLEQSHERPLIVIAGFVHDVSDFIEVHPGGPNLLKNMIGKDATTAFFGGVYQHSNAAHNLLAMKRVGVLHGGISHISEEKAVPPCQRLRIAEWGELK